MSHDERLTVVEDAEAAAQVVADLLLRLAEKELCDRPSLGVALAGGSTPRRCYELLALAVREGRASLAGWDVFLGDERVVSPDDAGSNGRMLRDTLVNGGALPAARLHRMVDAWDPTEPPEAAAERAAVRYAAALPATLDVLLLGIGADGHTASLFPGSPALQERERAVLVTHAPVEPHLRISLTPPALAAARHVVVLASGASKAAAVRSALQGTPDVQATPAQLVRHAHWVLDRPAAAQLRP